MFKFLSDSDNENTPFFWLKTKERLRNGTQTGSKKMHTFLLVTESNFKTMRVLFHNFMLSLNFHRNLLECHKNGKSGEQCVDQISKLHPRQRTKTLGKLQSFCFVCIQYLGDRYWVFRLTQFILIFV